MPEGISLLFVEADILFNLYYEAQQIYFPSENTLFEILRT
jgi:hypothetical protein